MKKRNLVLSSAAALTLFLGACGTGGSGTAESGSASSEAVQSESTEVSVGVVSDVEVDVWEDVAERLQDQGIELEVVQFTDYTQPNMALESGDVDLNAFQSVAYLEEFNESNGSDLVNIGFTYVSPLGLYSNTYTDYNDLPDGATISLPNDVVNLARGLNLLQSAGLITLKESAGTEATLDDITENPKNLQFEELDAAQTAHSLQDVDAAIVNTNYALDSGLVPSEDALFLDTEKIEAVSEIYKNIVATRNEDADNEVYQTIVEEYQTEETAAKLEEVTNGNDVPAWE